MRAPLSRALQRSNSPQCARRLESWLEAERDQLAVVAAGCAWARGSRLGSCCPMHAAWIGTLAGFGALAGLALATGIGGRASRARADRRRLRRRWGWRWSGGRPSGSPRRCCAVRRSSNSRARSNGSSRWPRAIWSGLRSRQLARPDLPPRVRVNLSTADVPAGLTRGATITVGARLMPPAAPAVPGAYDFARVAWFQGLGASGRGFAPVKVVVPARARVGPAQPACPRISASGCRAARAGSRRRWRRAIRAGSATKMPKRCGARGWRICCRSAGCTSPPSSRRRCSWCCGCSRSARRWR